MTGGGSDKLERHCEVGMGYGKPGVQKSEVDGKINHKPKDNHLFYLFLQEQVMLIWGLG